MFGISEFSSYTVDVKDLLLWIGMPHNLKDSHEMILSQK